MLFALHDQPQYCGTSTEDRCSLRIVQSIEHSRKARSTLSERPREPEQRQQGQFGRAHREGEWRGGSRSLEGELRGGSRIRGPFRGGAVHERERDDGIVERNAEEKRKGCMEGSRVV